MLFGNIYVGGTTKKLYGHDKIIIARKMRTLLTGRFIIAHELGHYLMDCVGSSLEKNPKDCLHKHIQKKIMVPET